MATADQRSAAFFEYGVAGADDRGLRALSQQFAGAWPYLELIASATGVEDPLDPRVVEAYWVGSPRLDQVSTRAVGARWKSGSAALPAASSPPHHQRACRGRATSQFRGVLHLPLDRPVERRPQGRHALTVLDRCRIRWGQVRASNRRSGRRRIPLAHLGRSPARHWRTRSRDCGALHRRRRHDRRSARR